MKNINLMKAAKRVGTKPSGAASSINGNTDSNKGAAHGIVGTHKKVLNMRMSYR